MANISEETGFRVGKPLKAPLAGQTIGCPELDPFAVIHGPQPNAVMESGAMPQYSPFRFRPIRAADLPAAIRLIEQDRVFYEPGTWSRLPAFLEQFLRQGRVRGAVIEELGSGRLRFVGLTGFASPESLKRAIEGERSLPEALIAGGGLLPPSQVAKANATRDLHLAILCGCPDVVDLAKPEGYWVHRALTDAFAYQHGGYGLRGMWQEAAIPEAIAFLQGMGMTVERERAGGRSRLMSFTAEQAQLAPSGALAFFFRFPPPRLGLTTQQQQLLELALLDLPDREIKTWLGLSDEALKKRWHSGYARVRKSNPDLLPAGLPGADQRRALLGYLRQHLEELRPTRSC